jgi:uncharacterized YccA/Bax inhibitor family protein
MRSNNPAFTRSPAFSARATYSSVPTASAEELNSMYSAPPATGAQAGRMTYDDVVAKTGIAFGTLLLGAAFAWFVAPGLAIPGLIVGLVLGLVIAFKQSTNPALILSYAAFEGLFVGGISRIFSERWDGIVPQAGRGTLLAFVAMLAVYKSGRLRVTPKFTRSSWAPASRTSVSRSSRSSLGPFFDVGDGAGFRTGPLGILLGLAGATLPASSSRSTSTSSSRACRNGCRSATAGWRPSASSPRWCGSTSRSCACSPSCEAATSR